jgi:hypothetical protein
VTGAAGGTSDLSLDPNPGVNGTHLTGEGVVMQAAGFLDNPMTADTNNLIAGPLAIGCNSPTTGTPAAGPSLGSIPIVAPVVFGPTTVMPNGGGGSTVTASLVATPVPAPSYQWEVSTDNGSTWSVDTTDAGNTSLSLTVIPTASNANDQYRLVGTNSVSNPTATPSGPFVVSTAIAPAASVPLEVAPVVTTQPANASVTTGQSATFTAAASGSPTPTVQWQVSTDGGATFTNVAGAISTTLTVPATTTSQSGSQYRAVFTNLVASATSSAATLTVTAPPNAPVVSAVIPSHGFPFSIVIILGKNLRRATAVNFGTVKAPFFLHLTDRLIIAIAPMPPTAGATVDVTVTSAAGTSATSTADQFTFTTLGH